MNPIALSNVQGDIYSFKSTNKRVDIAHILRIGKHNQYKPLCTWLLTKWTSQAYTCLIARYNSAPIIMGRFNNKNNGKAWFDN